MTRTFLLAAAAMLAASAHGQSAARVGEPFTRSFKNAQGDQHAVVDGVLPADGRALLYVEEGPAHKVVRLDAQLKPAEEVVLKDVLLDGVKWNGVMPVLRGGTMDVLLVSPGKKGADLGMATVGGSPLALSGFRRLTSFGHAWAVDPASSLARRPLPDPILFSLGLTSAHTERLLTAPDGGRHLLNMYDSKGKDGKQLWMTCLDRDLREEWSALATLPWPAGQARIHQMQLTNDGRVLLLAYVFRCEQEQMGDKNCHELHFTTISDQGRTVKDVLVDKDFVSTARFCERPGGRISLALRYGALTGIPGQVVTFDPQDPKLKPTPLVDQRLAGVRRVKLTGFGSVDGDPNKPASVRAKLPDEVVTLLPGWDGGTVLIEAFVDNEFQLPVGEAIAMRHFCGMLRASYLDATDTVRWQRTIDRAYLTTAGQAYETAGLLLDADGLTLLFGHTPKGLAGILASGGAGDGSSPLPEPGVLKAARIDRAGQVLRQGTAWMPEGGLAACPMTAVFGAGGTQALLKAYDRGTTYRYVLVDLERVGAE